MSKIIIISYFNLNDSKSRVGGLRPFYLYKYLLKEGLNAFLLTRTLPENVEHNITIKEGWFIKLIKPILRIFPPDNAIAWSFKVFIHLKKMSRREDLTVFTTSPPNSLGIIGWMCKKFCINITWIADYRDLWTKNTLYNPPITKKYFDPILEKKFHQHADFVILNTKWDLKLHRTLHPIIMGKSTFMRNGYNKLFTNNSQLSNKFIYCGGTYKGMATDVIITLLDKMNQNSIAQFSCDFYGEKDVNMQSSQFINYCGSVQSSAVPELLSNYKIGFVYLPEGSENGGRVAQKLYDYIGSKVIPICINSSVEMQEIIEDINTGLCINNNTPINNIVKFIENSEFKASDNKRKSYLRNNQYKSLVDEMKVKKILN